MVVYSIHACHEQIKNPLMNVILMALTKRLY